MSPTPPTAAARCSPGYHLKTRRRGSWRGNPPRRLLIGLRRGDVRAQEGFPGARRGPAPASPLCAPPSHRLRTRRAPGRQALPRAVAGLRLGLAPGAATAAGGRGVGGLRSGFWEFTIFPFSETRMFPYNGPNPCFSGLTSLCPTTPCLCRIRGCTALWPLSVGNRCVSYWYEACSSALSFQTGKKTWQDFYADQNGEHWHIYAINYSPCSIHWKVVRSSHSGFWAPFLSRRSVREVKR